MRCRRFGIDSPGLIDRRRDRPTLAPALHLDLYVVRDSNPLRCERNSGGALSTRGSSITRPHLWSRASRFSVRSQPSSVARIFSSTWTAKAAMLFPSGLPPIGGGISPSSAPSSTCRVLRNRARAQSQISELMPDDKFSSCGYSSPRRPRRRSYTRPMNHPIANTTKRKAKSTTALTSR